MASLEMLSGRSKKDYAKEAQAAASAEGDSDQPGAITAGANGAPSDVEAVVAM